MSILSEEDQPIVGQYYQIQDRYCHDKIYNGKYIGKSPKDYCFSLDIPLRETYNGCNNIKSYLIAEPIFNKCCFSGARHFSGVFRALFFNVSPELAQ